MNIFTTKLGLPAPVAVLVILAESAGAIGLIWRIKLAHAVAALAQHRLPQEAFSGQCTAERRHIVALRQCRLQFAMGLWREREFGEIVQMETGEVTTKYAVSLAPGTPFGVQFDATLQLPVPPDQV